jgi:hypothetical protein
MNQSHSRSTARNLKSPLPLLPLVHVTTLSNFKRIWQCGRLIPKTCPVLGKDILYCSYGDVVYRKSRDKRMWSVDPPVAMVLAPRVLTRPYTFFPFDTGAIASGRVRWFPDAKRSPLASTFGRHDRFGRNLSTWVEHMFGDSARYIDRQLMPASASLTDDAHIVRTLSEAAAAFGIPNHAQNDMRIISQIECHFDREIEVDRAIDSIYLPSEARFLHQELSTHPTCSFAYYDDHPIAGNLPTDLVNLVRNRIARDA